MMPRPLRPDAVPVTDEQLAFISRTDADLRESAKSLSFDYERMGNRVDGGPWALVVQAHLYHDHILSLTLAQNLPRPDALKLDRISFAQKMDLARALSLAPESLWVFWKKLNRVRNAIAHDLDYEVTDGEIESLKAALPGHLKEVAATGGKNPAKPQTLQEVLITTIYFADHNRQQLSGNRLVSEKYSLMMQAAVAGQAYRRGHDDP